MNRIGHGPLIVFAACVLAVVAALAWVTSHALRLEAREQRAGENAKVQESIRLVLWRMDSAVNALVAKEAARPYFEYQPFYGAERAYTRMYDKEFEPGELLVPSPLLRGPDQFIRLHFQRQPDGAIDSPQVPTGNMRDLAESQLVSSDSVIAAEERLAELRSLLDPPVAKADDKRLFADKREERAYRDAREEDEKKAPLVLGGENRRNAGQAAAPAPQQQAWAQSYKEYEARQNLASVAANAPKQLAATTQREAAAKPGEPLQFGTPPVSTPGEGRSMGKSESTQPEADSSRLAALPAKDGNVRAEDRKNQEKNAAVPVAEPVALSAAPSPNPATEGAVPAEAVEAAPGNAIGFRKSPTDDRTGDAERMKLDATLRLDLESAATARGSASGKAAVPTLVSDGIGDGAVRRVLELREQDAMSSGSAGGSSFIGSVSVVPSGGSKWDGPGAFVADPARIAPQEQAVVLGAFTPRWVARDAKSEPELVFVRTIHARDASFEQGVWVDWPALRGLLKETAGDLLHGAAVTPVLDSTRDDPASLGRRLASIPAELSPGTPISLTAPRWSPMRTTLLLTWAGVLAAVGAIAFVLRASMDLAERRGQFVSAVTHELRTPLTTFCLYSQMLADGMVSEASSQKEYLGTLKSESTRLAKIVENVLEYARLGRRKTPHDRAEIGATDLIARLEPVLRRRAEQCGMELVVQSSGPSDARVSTDVATVERILYNLVENACKYAGDSPDKRILLNARAERGAVAISIRDHGPGVAAHERARVFRPFFRGERQRDGSVSGLGLGLSLARGLAQELGGELKLAEGEGAGAEFVLTIPTVRGVA